MLSIFMSTAVYNNAVIASYSHAYYDLILNDDFENISDLDGYH